MKKKIEKLRREGRLEGNSAFEALWDEVQAAETSFEKAKTDRKIAKSTFQFERSAEQSDETHRDNVFELLIAWRKADGQRQIRRAELQLAKYRLRRWLEAFARLPKAAEPEGPATKIKKKTTPAKAKKGGPENPAEAPAATDAPVKTRKKTKTS